MAAGGQGGVPHPFLLPMQIPAQSRVVPDWSQHCWYSSAGMSLPGVPRSLSRPPPPPPPPPRKRPDTWEHLCGEELLASDEEDMYEVPPCEGLLRWVAPAQAQLPPEGTYLDHTQARRSSAPAPCLPPARLLSQLSLAPTTEDEEEEVKGWGAMPSSTRRSSLPTLGLAMLRGANPDPLERKEEPLEDATYVQFQLTPAPCCLEGSEPPMEDPELCAQPWYAGSCDRQTAETALLYANKDGAYLVRRSGRGGPQPYTLAVLLGARVYNIPVRLIPGPRPFALGRTNTCPELFPSVPSMVWHYTQHPLVLVDGTTCARQHTRLIYPVKP